MVRVLSGWFGVFPARAGMIRRLAESILNWNSIPRESGDDPALLNAAIGDPRYSPRERG